MRTPARWISRSALIGSLVCFGLPFVAVSSCSGNDQPKGKATYSGVDLLTNSKPSATLDANSPPGALSTLSANVVPLVALTLVVIVLTLLAATPLLARVPGLARQPRLVVALGAIAAFVLLVITEIAAAKHVGIGLPADLAADPNSHRGGGQAQIGFFLSSLLLVATAITVGVDRLLDRRRRPVPVPSVAAPPGSSP